jgi:hypothetical protein
MGRERGDKKRGIRSARGNSARIYAPRCVDDTRLAVFQCFSEGSPTTTLSTESIRSKATVACDEVDE